MALSATYITKFYEIIGIPQGGTGVIITSLSHIPPTLANSWEPTFTTGDFSDIVTQIDALLAALTSEQQTQVMAYIDEYDTITKGSPLQVDESDDAKGVIVDDKRKIENLRQGLGNIIGLWVPPGGFYAETQRIMKGSGRGDR